MNCSQVEFEPPFPPQHPCAPFVSARAKEKELHDAMWSPCVCVCARVFVSAQQICQHGVSDKDLNTKFSHRCDRLVCVFLFSERFYVNSYCDFPAK